MSVDVASIQLDMLITLRNGAGIAEIKTETARALGQDVVDDPLPSEPAHALVIGHKPKSIRRALRDAARFVARAEMPSAG